jgi:aminoglycoside phosphotransferase
MRIDRLPHGYTNATSQSGHEVTKRYRGPDAESRCRREAVTLRALDGRIPVPPVVAVIERCLTVGFVDGAHGQDLIDAGRAEGVLEACGRMLRVIHAISPQDVVPGEQGRVLVHGDYGPNNVLLDPDTLHVVAVVDWEWTHGGEPIEDLAWCEWIVRAHHREHIDALDDLFVAYGQRPSWSARQEAMVTRHRRLIEFSQRWEPGGEGVRTWRDRLATAERWTE